MARIFDEVLSGHLERGLTTLSLADGHGASFQGQGKIVWSRKEGVRIDCMTDGADTLLATALFVAPCPPGHLIPPEYYLRVEGKTQSGAEVSIGRISRNDYEVHAGQPLVAWRIKPSNVLAPVIIREQTTLGRKFPRTNVLFTPQLRLWPRVSTVEDKNPRFGTRSSAHDWLEFKCSIGRVSARKLGGDDALAHITHRTRDAASHDAAVGLAFSFLEGRTVFTVATETDDGALTTLTLRDTSRIKNRGSVSGPLANNPALNHFREPLLINAVDFFRTPIGIKAGDLLFMYQSASDASFTTRALIVCVVLESLVKLLVPSKRAEATINEEQKERIVSNLKEMGISDEVVKRFSGFIGKMDEVSPKNYLRLWAKKGLLGITDADIKAWDGLRPRIAHGRLLWTAATSAADKQSELTSVQRVQNMVNKLLLNAMKFEGAFFDYADWSMKDFPRSDLAVS